MPATPKPLVLIILDGFGHSDNPEYNAIHAANTPVYDRLRATQPHGLISGSGMDVGLPDMDGEPTHEPTFGLPAMWIDAAQRDEANFRGCTVVDPPSVLTTGATNPPELITPLPMVMFPVRRVPSGTTTVPMLPLINSSSWS